MIGSEMIKIVRISLISIMLAASVMGCGSTRRDAPPPAKQLGNPKRPPLPPTLILMPLDPVLQHSAKNILIELTTSTDPILRANAIEAIQKTHGITGAPYYLRGLEDKEPIVRFAAAMAVGTSKTAEAKNKLLAIVDDPNPSVRVAIRYALHRLGDYHLSRELEKYAQDVDPQVRGNTALVVGLLGEPSGLNILNSMKLDLDLNVKLQVLEAMYRLGDDYAMERLVVVTLSAFPDDQIFALLALGDRNDSRVIKAVGSKLAYDYTEVALAAARVMGQLDSDEGMGVALKSIGSKDPRQRYMAALALGDIGRADAQPSLSPLLKDPDNNVRLAAATALLLLKNDKPEIK